MSSSITSSRHTNMPIWSATDTISPIRFTTGASVRRASRSSSRHRRTVSSCSAQGHPSLRSHAMAKSRSRSRPISCSQRMESSRHFGRSPPDQKGVPECAACGLAICADGGARRKAQARLPGRIRPAARAVSVATGAFVNDDPVCLQATGFVLNPEGRIATAVYSTRAIGRLLPDDVLGFVRYLRSSAKN